MLSENQIIITDEKIVSFFRNHSALDPTTIVSMFVDVLEQLGKNINNNMEQIMTNSVLGKVTKDIEQMKNTMQQYNCTLNSFQITVIDRVVSLRDNFKIDFREILQANSSIETNRLETFLKERIQLMVSEISQCSVQNFQPLLTQMLEKDLPLLLKNLKSDSLTIQGLEDNLCKFLVPINSQIDLLKSQQQFEVTVLTDLSEKTVRSKSDEDNFHREARDYFSKSVASMEKLKHNPSEKGAKAEADLMEVLQRMFKQDRFYKPPTKTCDIVMERRDASKPNILFEVKNYSKPVDRDEVLKFQADVERNQMHGIFVSTKTAIFHKDEYEIQLIGKNILVYLPFCDCDEAKLRGAISIVDNLAQIVDVYHSFVSQNKKSRRENKLQESGKHKRSRNISTSEDDSSSINSDSSFHSVTVPQLCGIGGVGGVGGGGGGGGGGHNANSHVVQLKAEEEEEEPEDYQSEDDDEEEDLRLLTHELIPKIDLENIANEFKNIANRKKSLITQLKAFQTQIEMEINKIEFPSLKLLLTQLKLMKLDEISCKYCLQWSHPNKLSVSAHERKCSENPKIKNNVQPVVASFLKPKK